MSLIALHSISRHYAAGGERVCAVDGLDLMVGGNEYVALIGPSGSGKSTLMNILGCLDRPSSGQYLLNGRDVGALDPDALAELRNREIGFIFQTFNLIPRMSALMNVMQPLVYRGISHAVRSRMAAESLSRVGLSARMSHRPNELSGGQRQRVAIARALVTRPSMLLADEPTGNLDSASTAQIMGIFDELHAGGQTIIVVTHDPAVAQHCGRVVEISDGRIVRDSRRRH